MSHGGAPSGYEQVSDLFRNQHAVWQIVAVWAPHHRAVISVAVMNVHRITSNSYRVLELVAVQDVVRSQDIFSLDDTAFADTHERSHPVSPRVLESWYEIPEVSFHLIILEAGLDFPLGVAFWIG